MECDIGIPGCRISASRTLNSAGVRGASEFPGAFKRATNAQAAKRSEQMKSALLDSGICEVQSDYGLLRILDLGGDSERITVSHLSLGGVVISTQAPPASFNWRRSPRRDSACGERSFGA